MTSQSKKEPKVQRAGPENASVGALASRALALVAERSINDNGHLDLDLADRLRDAATDADGEAVSRLISEMRNAGIAAETVALTYIPHAARQMGQDWCDDTLSFARVTIGTARLQSSLRSLGSEWGSHGYSDRADEGNGSVVIVARDSYHTLGAMILCGQLRRMGLSVRLAMGATNADLKVLFGTSAYDAVLISASEAETLESLQECVDVIRHSSSVSLPIILGGSVLDQDGDVKALTGADFVTKDPLEALTHCGLTEKLRSQTPPTKRRT